MRPTLLSTGSFASIYIDTQYDSPIVYKVQFAPPFSTQRDRIRNEIRIQKYAAKRCAYVPHVYDDVVIPSLHRWCMRRICSFTFAMECVQGDTLHKHLSVHYTSFTLLQMYHIMTQLKDAVTQLHAIGIVHRDIKNDNIMIEMPLAKLRIIDFGLATRRAQPYNEYQPMRTSVGTMSYSSPQVVFGQSYTAKCDWWSVGVVCYVLLFGIFPFALRVSDIRDYVMFQVAVDERTMYTTPLEPIQNSRLWPVKSKEEYNRIELMYQAIREWLVVAESDRMGSS